ncbi:40S ribosomal protein S13 [Capsicum annuum]|uniref:40S ribosomal protein S13 n=1 Tax=Capsicum annuum TaxID=4072 RepID=A0A2G2ZBD8_CAPAN|nr:40S ribosomal protein S13 [Capsicum annuum]PHT79185.1 40S ribosomal protein S13 [Capsicum annuum]
MGRVVVRVFQLRLSLTRELLLVGSRVKISAPDVEDNICKFAKKGLTPSQIGVILRDSHGIARVKECHS